MSNCAFCNQDVQEQPSSERMSVSITCPVCGRYELATSLAEAFKSEPLSARVRVACSSQSIKDSESQLVPIWQRERSSESVNAPLIRRAIKDFENLAIQHSLKLDQILMRMAELSTKDGPFSKVRLVLKELYRLKIDGFEEAKGWLAALIQEGLIYHKKLVLENHGGVAIRDIVLDGIAITPKGWSRIEQVTRAAGTRKAFIAMSFDKAIRGPVQTAIQEACREHGWEAETVDEPAYLGLVTDKIVAMINQSRFVVADFTQNKTGVYFEAGYAAGLGLNVIYTVSKADVDKLHFDTRNFNHIVWDDVADLKTKLSAKIGAVIR